MPPFTYADALALADAAEIVVDQQQTSGVQAGGSDSSPGVSGTPDGPPEAAAPEADDDPHRLARVNLAHYNTRTDGRTIAYWREEWYVWKRNCYRKISDKELRAKLSASIKNEFDRLCRERQAMAAESARDGADALVAQKVTSALVTNVLQATSGMTCVGGEVEPNTWLPTKQRRHYVSMANGLLDMDALLGDADNCLLPNTPQWFSFSSLPYAFDPDAQCPKWQAVLNFNLANDRALIAVVQEWAGYLLLHSTDEQKFMILEGEGQNGKSVLLAGIAAMLGAENVSRVPLELFGDKFQLHSTLGKLLNAAADCGDLDKSAEGILKSFTAGDPMRFDRKGLPPVDCTPTARLMVACNNRPRFSDRTKGVWRRMLVVPFTIEVPPEKMIKGMDKPAWWEASGELPGIFLWAVVGLARLRTQHDFTRSDTSRQALDEYQEEMNPAKSFLQQYLEEFSAGMIRCSDVYRLYKKWSEENGYRPLSERPFGKEVRRTFKNSARVHRGSRSDRYWAYEGVQFSQDVICGEAVADCPLF